MKKPIICVTGVGGFIGSTLVERLVNEGYPVIGICRRLEEARGRVPKEVLLHECDIRLRQLWPLFSGIDIVFHLAAKSSSRECQEDPVDTMDINVVGTANVFDAARRAGVRKVIYAQSSVLEEGEARRDSFYTISKIADENLAQGFHSAFELTTIGLRYFNVYGSGQDYRRKDSPVISKFIIALLRGQQPVLFEGHEESRRDFIHIDDIHRFHLMCIEDPRVDNRMFRIGSGRNYSMKEILDTIQEILGTHVAPIIKPRFTHDPATSTLADISDARALGWEPKITLREGLRSVVTYIQSEIVAGRISI